MGSSRRAQARRGLLLEHGFSAQISRCMRIMKGEQDTVEKEEDLVMARISSISSVKI